MVKASTKLFFTGIAGAAGVVATTQIPDVQAAVNAAVNVTPNEKQVGKFSNVATFIHNKSSEVTLKSDILREKHTKDSKLATFKEDTKREKKSKGDINTVASNAMTDAISASNVQSDTTEETSAYYDDSATSADTDKSSTPAEDAVVSESDAANKNDDAMSAYTIKDGDTLATVAANTGVSVADLQAANPNADTTMLTIGQSLSIPGGGYVNVPDTDTTTTDTVAADTTTSADATTAVPDQGYTDQTTQTFDGTATYATDSNSVADQSIASEPVQQSFSDTTVGMQDATLNRATGKASVKSLGTAVPKQDSQATIMSNGDVVLNSLDDTVVQNNNNSADETNSDKQKVVQTKTATSLTADQRAGIVSAAQKYATQQVPYVSGGKSVNGLDASGLVARVYHDAGVNIPRYTVSQEAHMTTTDVQSDVDVMQVAQPGDLLFWGGHGASWQVAIYIGNGQYAIASQADQRTEIMSLSDTEVLPDFVGEYSFK